MPSVIRRLKFLFTVAVLGNTLPLLAPTFGQQAAKQTSADASAPGALTVDIIYGQPSLSGRLDRGLAWSPNGKTLTFLKQTPVIKALKAISWLST